MVRHKVRRIAVSGYILNKRGEILLLRRAAHDSMPGAWEVPGGGLEFGEKPEDGVKREVKEESGLEVTVIKPLGITHSLSLKKGIQKDILRIGFLCQALDTEKITLSPDHDAYQWINPDKIEKLKNASKSLIELIKTLDKNS